MRSKLGSWSLGGKSVEQGGKAMPAVSAKQKRFMDSAAHSPEFAKKAGIPTKVAKEFSQSSKGMKFSKGEDMKKSTMEAGGVSKKLPSPKQMGNLGMKAGGLADGHKSANGVAKRGLTKGTMVKMAKGGMAKKYC